MKMKALTKPKSVPNLKTAASEYLRLKKEQGEIEAQLALHRDVLKAGLENSLDGKLDLCDHVFTLIEVTSESFNLKAALEKLDKRTLKPFIRSTTYTKITVGFK